MVAEPFALQGPYGSPCRRAWRGAPVSATAPNQQEPCQKKRKPRKRSDEAVAHRIRKGKCYAKLDEIRERIDESVNWDYFLSVVEALAVHEDSTGAW